MRPDHFNAVFDAPVWMSFPERVALYATVFGRAPRRMLEIGTFKGGSSLIIVSAMDDVGRGELVCVDPAPQIEASVWERIEHRVTLLEGPSPQSLGDAVPAGAAGFDVALIDGDHSYDGVVADLEGTLPLLTDEASILFHDAYFDDVRRALDDMLGRHRDHLIDCGLISTLRTPDEHNPDVTWGGLREFRYVRRGRD